MSKTILIAEDNDVTREMMAAVLKQEGYAIVQAVDGSTAMKVVKDKPVDLALVDLHMAPAGGFDFVKYIKAEGLDIPVIIITADQGSDLLLAAKKHGILRLLQKI